VASPEVRIKAQLCPNAEDPDFTRRVNARPKKNTCPRGPIATAVLSSDNGKWSMTVTNPPATTMFYRLWQ